MQNTPHQIDEEKEFKSESRLRLEKQEEERLTWYNSLTEIEKVEYLGARYFNRHGEPEWEDHNSLYEESEGFSDFITTGE